MEKLTIEDITLENWPKYQRRVLHQEGTFPRNMRENSELFLDTLSQSSTISLAGWHKGKYVGNTWGCDYQEFHGRQLGGRTFQAYRTVVSPRHRGKGFGYQLFMERLYRAKEAGFTRLVGEFREGNSLLLVRRLNAREIKVLPNWEDSGETYVRCELNLRKFERPT